MSLLEDYREVRRFSMAQWEAVGSQGLRKLVLWKLALQKLDVLRMPAGPLVVVWP